MKEDKMNLGLLAVDTTSASGTLDRSTTSEHHRSFPLLTESPQLSPESDQLSISASLHELNHTSTGFKEDAEALENGVNKTGTWKKRTSLLKRIRREVKRALSEAANPGREGALVSFHRHIKGKNRIVMSYREIKNALKDMQDKYVSSKDTKNIIGRYSIMKKMIREVTIFERQYWTLIDLPKQNLSESQVDYIGRVLTTLENRIDDSKPMSPTKAGLGGLLGKQAILANQAKEAKLLETYKTKSADELRKETANLQAEMCKLIKKYLGLRVLVAQLHNDFEASKNYPIIPRYTLLKGMIKNVLRDPSFSEICHEIEED